MTVLIDLIILATLGTYAYGGYRRGLLAGVAELVGFVLALTVAFLIYAPLGQLVAGAFRIPAGMAGLGAFLVSWMVLETAFSVSWRKLQRHMPLGVSPSPINRIAGIIPAVFQGVLLLVILVLVVATAPIPAEAKQPIVGSFFGKSLLGIGTAYEQRIDALFGQALRDTLAFKTIKTGSNDSTPLGFTNGNPKTCEADEQKLFDKTNQERQKIGVGTLRSDDDLRDVGRLHSRDMFARGYFAHITPDGQDPFDRMHAAGISYTFAGENLALAPTVEIAHSGLMNSPGHRENILKPDFTRLGIGCADAGLHGKVFSEEFAG